MSDLPRPLDVAEATEVLLSYASAIDERDWEALRSCFTPDCSTTYDERRIDGIDELVGFMAKVHRRIDATLHRITNVRIPPAWPSRTTAYVDALLIRRGSSNDLTLRFEGVYTDTWAPTPAGWRIAERRYRTVWHRRHLEPTADRATHDVEDCR